MARIRRAAVVAALVVPVLAAGGVVAVALSRSDETPPVVVPTGWEQAWEDGHVREGDAVVLAWGDLPGADPTHATLDLRFDPARTVAALDELYGTTVEDLAVAAPDGAIAASKVVVVVDGTWTQGPGSGREQPVAPAHGGLSAGTRAVSGAVDGGVGLVRATVPALAGGGGSEAPAPSWDLARGFAEMVLDFARSESPEGSVAGDSAGAFADASAAYLATIGAAEGIGDLADLVRSPSVPWSSARLGDGGWLLLQYLAERDDDRVVSRIWRGADGTRTALEAYRGVAGLTESALNRRVAEYAMRTVAWDLGPSRELADAVAALDPVLLAGRTTPVEAVPDDPGHYRVPDAFAPSDYGFNVVRLEPEPGARTVHVRLRGNSAAPDAGWSVGFVALGGESPRYSPVTEGDDAELQFSLRDGEGEVYLVVTGTPARAHVVDSASGFGDVPRYPYEFRLAGATVVDESTQPAAPGGHRHPNGGGWVDDAARVDATAYVGPHAVVRGDARVTGSARVEGRAWVEPGAVVGGDAVVKDMAVVRSSARLSGSVVVGGDAVVSFSCDAGGYVAYEPARTCDGQPAGADVNVAPTPLPADALVFADPQLAPPQPAVTATAEPEPGPSSSPSQQPTQQASRPPVPPAGGGGAGTGTPAPPPANGGGTDGGVAPPEPVTAGGCSATYRVTTTWESEGRAWYQAELVVTAGSAGVSGWAVSWTLPAGKNVTAVWNAQLGTSGSAVTAENMSYNGTLRAGETATFGLQGTAPSPDVARAVHPVACTQTR
ncbi:DUF6055 domain-containing protein [Cellulomonas fimi]|uniref:DUF6055 domain-containing protein n=1 Tax=Cellulomonas fimi TaxID=1708 RepID=UPI00234C16A5|nr:DUF6055 domain-containing protein [Cellulomonas fimi]MDC7119934.1 DUF6055 domain-containing protein [Cellulomonas fimi]